MNDKYAFLNLKVKYSYIVFVCTLLFLLILLSSIHYQTYDSYKSTGTYKNNKISISYLFFSIMLIQKVNKG